MGLLERVLLDLCSQLRVTEQIPTRAPPIPLNKYLRYYQLLKNELESEVCKDNFFDTETEEETRHGHNLKVEARVETFP